MQERWAEILKFQGKAERSAADRDPIRLTIAGQCPIADGKGQWPALLPLWDNDQPLVPQEGLSIDERQRSVCGIDDGIAEALHLEDDELETEPLARR
jgi:hypothetical protein